MNAEVWRFTKGSKSASVRPSGPLRVNNGDAIPLGAVYWVTPPEGPLPKRVEVLGDYLIDKLARGAVAENHKTCGIP